MAMSGADALDRFQRLGQQPWLATLQRRGPGLAALVLAVVVAWQIAGLVVALLPARADANIAPPVALAPAAGDAAAVSEASTDVSAIVKASLFGVARAEDETPIVNPCPPDCDDDYEETKLPLELRGTLAANTEDSALAIIKDGPKERVYSIGDTVRSGVKLYAVQREQVLLTRGGAIESLKLPKPEDVTGTVPQANRSRTSIRRASGPSMSQVLTENAAQFTQIISPRPYYVGGQQRGYRLYPGSDRQSFAKLGLRPGDIVTAINGTPLNNPSQGARIFSELGSAQSISVTLERGGQQQNLTLDTSSLDFSDQATQ
ncbi:MAG: type II secretion system protein GspC [Pseudomonadota bacterium]